MKRTCLLTVILIATSSHATTATVAPGSSLSTDPSSNTYSVFAATYNPALANLTIADEEKWRFSYAPGFSLAAEAGDVANFIDDLDELIDLLHDPASTNDSTENTLERFNAALTAMGKDGYLKISNRITAPMMPTYYRPSFVSGTFFVELDITTQANLSILDSELIHQSFHFTTASSAYIKSGVQTRFALGYSRELFRGHKFEPFGGRLFGGAKINIIHMALSQQIFRLEQLGGKDIKDVMQDEYNNNMKSSTAVALDLGLAWIADRYRLGFTVRNINSPTFDYGSISVNCGQHNETLNRYNDCGTEYFFAHPGKVTTNKTHTKHPVPTLDASFYLTPYWMLHGAVELATYDDLVGIENQWVSLSSTYNFKTKSLPNLRVGFHRNLVGSGLTSVALGTSLFGRLTLDIAKSLDETTVDDSVVPRNFSFAIGFEETF